MSDSSDAKVLTAKSFFLRKAHNRGHANHGWLDSHHTFSFADYYDPQHMGFSVLRVINEDRIAGGTGFGTHGHRDMEIISYVLEGGLEHKDSMGNSTKILPGEVQRMSAGTGVQHSEFNASTNEVGHFLQIWILPDRSGHRPSYAQKSFLSAKEQSGWVLALSHDQRDDSLGIHQDVDLYLGGCSGAGQRNFVPKAGGRSAWIQLTKGKLKAGGIEMSPGDGLALEGLSSISLSWDSGADFLVFDLPK